LIYWLVDSDKTGLQDCERELSGEKVTR